MSNQLKNLPFSCRKKKSLDEFLPRGERRELIATDAFDTADGLTRIWHQPDRGCSVIGSALLTIRSSVYCR